MRSRADSTALSTSPNRLRNSERRSGERAWVNKASTYPTISSERFQPWSCPAEESVPPAYRLPSLPPKRDGTFSTSMSSGDRLVSGRNSVASRFLWSSPLDPSHTLLAGR